MSSYLQTHGYKQGTSIDPDTMEIMLNNEAVREVLELLKVRVRTSNTGHRGAMHPIITVQLWGFRVMLSHWV